MKTLLLSILVFGLAACIQGRNVIMLVSDNGLLGNAGVRSKVGSSNSSIIREIEEAWSRFKTDFKRAYVSLEEEEERLVHFVQNFIQVREHNALHAQGKKTFRQVINLFSDWTPKELKKLRGYRQPLASSGTTNQVAAYMSPALGSLQLPNEVDWRKEGYVTPVKNQGQCGSCWSFSSTGALEGQHYRKSGQLLSLSEQQLVDCNMENNGCNGGIMQNAFAYIKKSGIELERTYPYVSGNTEHREKKCHYETLEVVTKDAGFVEIPKGDENKLKEAVATIGPIAIAIDASQGDFQSYASGVYDSANCSSENLDHAVLLVGYGEEEGVAYWLVKNSWSAQWGDEGYIKMRRNKDNMCGIASMAVYPLV